MDLKGSLLSDGNWSFFSDGKHCEAETWHITAKLTLVTVNIFTDNYSSTGYHNEGMNINKSALPLTLSFQ